MPGIYQQNRLASVRYESLANKIKEENKRIYPKLEIILLKNEPLIKNEGYQRNISEEKRKIIESIYNHRHLRRKQLKKLKIRRWKNKKYLIKHLSFERRIINEFLNELNIEQNFKDNKDRIFNELKNIENNIILEIIMANKKLFKENIMAYLTKAKEDLYQALINVEKGMLYGGEKLLKKID